VVLTEKELVPYLYNISIELSLFEERVFVEDPQKENFFIKIEQNFTRY